MYASPNPLPEADRAARAAFNDRTAERAITLGG